MLRLFLESYGAIFKDFLVSWMLVTSSCFVNRKCFSLIQSQITFVFLPQNCLKLSDFVDNLKPIISLNKLALSLLRVSI